VPEVRHNKKGISGKIEVHPSTCTRLIQVYQRQWQVDGAWARQAAGFCILIG